MRALPFLLALLLLPSPALTQSSPLFETRAVWFATVLGDGGWPGGTLDPPDVQEAALRDRIAEAWSRGLNTFIFQAVARGDALYPSARLPWSARLRGPGVHPGYDPLQVAIEEAHSRGMELHVWFNVFRVGDTSTAWLFAGVTDPAHVLTAHPEWVQFVDGSPWIDPSSSEARAWLVENVMEIVDHYDLDAIHFDFIRYPQGGLPNDGPSFQLDPRGFADIDDWRRDNVSRFVRDVYARIVSTKPWVKVGAAPLGNYEPFPGAWPALWAYTDVFQASRDWLAEGVMDYLAPQLYFDIGQEPEPGNSVPSPDFAYLVRDWVDHSNGFPILAGLGPFKPVVREEIDAQIGTARDAGARGHAFFRYDHFLELDLTGAYPYPALPAPMPHRFEAVAPSAPVLDELDNSLALSWSPSEGSPADPVRAYALFYRQGAPPEARAEDLLAVVDGSQTTFGGIELKGSSSTPFYFSVAAVSRLGVLSPLSNPVSTEGLALSDEAAPGPPPFQLLDVYPNPASAPLRIHYSLDRTARVRLLLHDVLGRGVMAKDLVHQGVGSHEASLSVASLPAGVYLLTLEAGNHRAVRRVVIAH